MPIYVVGYDLQKAPDGSKRDYQPIWDQLGKWHGESVLESMWIIKTNRTADEIKSALEGLNVFSYPEDRFVVVRVGEVNSSSWAEFHPKAHIVGFMALQVSN